MEHHLSILRVIMHAFVPCEPNPHLRVKGVISAC